MIGLGITGVCVSLWQTVKAQEKTFRFSVLLPRFLNAGTESSNVGRVFVIITDCAEFGDSPPRCKFAGYGVHSGGGCCGRVLGVKGQNENSRASAAAKNAESGLDRRFAVAHAGEDRYRTTDALAEFPLEICSLVPAGDDERRALGCPDLAVGAGCPEWAKGQNDEIAKQPPSKSGEFDDSRVGKELREIGTNIPRLRYGRRTEIDEKHSGRRRIGYGWRLRGELHHLKCNWNTLDNRLFRQNIETLKSER